MRSMGADDEVRKNSPGAGIALFLSPDSIRLKRSSRRPPDWFAQVEIDADTCIFAKGIKKGFSPSGSGHEFGKRWRAHDQGSPISSSIKCHLHRRTYRRIVVPESDNHIGIYRGR